MKVSASNNIKQYFDQFIKDYDENSKNEIWESHNQKFIGFWNSRILNAKSHELADQEIDEVVRILDKNGKGNRKTDEAIAKVMIPQGVWRRMFNEIKNDEKLSKLINAILKERDADAKAKLIDELYKRNEGKKNHLTGQSGNAINTLLAAYDPFNNVSIVSLNDRTRLMEFLNIPQLKNYGTYSTGKKISQSNVVILQAFRNYGIISNARVISDFVYSPIFKAEWKKSPSEGDIEVDAPAGVNQESFEEKSLFYMESQLEDFIIKNWDRTELGKKYELIEKDGELLSQQFKTTIGRIDILAKEKKTGVYVVIELKKGQTSDETVGQLARYMGWVEENLSKGKDSKGIIISGYFDEKLNYAIKKVHGVEVFLYKVDFKLEEFKK